MFLALTTYDKQLTIEKMGLTRQVWSHEALLLKSTKGHKTAEIPALQKLTHICGVRALMWKHPAYKLLVLSFHCWRLLSWLLG